MKMKDKITEKSIELFGEKGFNETSIQDIVDSLGVTKGTFYYYFESKQQLLMDIHLTFIDDLLSRQKDILSDQSKSCKTKIFDIVRMLIKNIEKHGWDALIFFREIRHLNEEQMDKIVKKRALFQHHLEDLIKLGMSQGEFRGGLPADIVTLGILGMCNWSYFWFDPKGRVPDEKVAMIYVDMVLNGIAVQR
ncbi:AcrR family transcriptional regulator [Scopulibacillus daqui]|uniref:AcrR family transcriptional regulator n=1 Tax=Scopulibacillus daqui TaxID=1469162 RepID=A0ABS2Q4P9_9BACL|nr:AcrR family transcriptional regulator [Scopulibacillus daqui]